MTTTDELAELNRMRDEGNAAHDYTETWCKQGEIGHIVLGGGARVRYLRVGSGPPLLLMHTVRTQLDHFQLVIPRIADAFTVYAVDFPGMGWSDIVAGTSYEEPALRAAILGVVGELDLSDLTLAGESMGATLALTASVDLRDRVRRIVAFNTYDFADGVKRASLFARLVAGSIEAPLIGPAVARLENRQILRGVMRGGLQDPRHLPEHYLEELGRVGRRPGYPTVARAILRNLESLIAARKRYARINVPVRSAYGSMTGRGSRIGGRTSSRFPAASHHAAQHGSLHRTGSTRRGGADPARRRPRADGLGGLEAVDAAHANEEVADHFRATAIRSTPTNY
jgi:pimeloyl-ACP methyl ester carboxylesterase